MGLNDGSTCAVQPAMKPVAQTEAEESFRRLAVGGCDGVHDGIWTGQFQRTLPCSAGMRVFSRLSTWVTRPS